MDVQLYLNKILNRSIFDIGRAADMLWIEFDSQKVISKLTQQERIVGQYALHVQCPWRLIQNGKIIAASYDIYLPNSFGNNEDQEFERDVVGDNLFDENIHKYFHQNKQDFTVQKIYINSYGDFKIKFSNALELDIFINTSSKEETEESWRLFNPYSKENYIVVYGCEILMEES